MISETGVEASLIFTRTARFILCVYDVMPDKKMGRNDIKVYHFLMLVITQWFKLFISFAAICFEVYLQKLKIRDFIDQLESVIRRYETISEILKIGKFFSKYTF